jgi:hypothetical protein
MPAVVRVSDQQRRTRLAARHRLDAAHRSDAVAAIADGLVALHATDPASVYLSAMARMVHPAVEPVSGALLGERSVLRHHGMRRTIWVYTVANARAAHAACTVDLARKEWRGLTASMAAGGMDHPEVTLHEARTEILAAIHRLGPTNVRALGKALPHLTAKVPMGSGKFLTLVPLHARVVQNLGFDGTIVRTTPARGWTSSEFTWSVTADWLAGPIDGAEPETARNDLIERYVRAFGPASTADIQWWTGLTATTVKAALTTLGAVEVVLEGGEPAWLLADDLAELPEPEPWVALLPALDPTTMGWKARGWYLGELAAFGGPLFDRNGNAGPTVWADGKAVGGWAQRPDGTIAVELLRRVDRGTRRAVTARAREWEALLADVRVTPRFPTPLQRTLAAS